MKYIYNFVTGLVIIEKHTLMSSDCTKTPPKCYFGIYALGEKPVILQNAFEKCLTSENPTA